MKDRGKALEAPDWWLEIGRAKVEHAGGFVELGRQLAKLVGRATPWNHSVLSKFVNRTQQPTQELAIAISLHFAIPRPFYVPRSLGEARAMQAVIDIQQPPTKFTDTVRAARERAHMEHLEVLEAEAVPHTDQIPQAGADSGRTAHIQSGDEDTARTRRRRSRGIHRGR